MNGGIANPVVTSGYYCALVLVLHAMTALAGPLGRANGTECPRLVSREEWKARPPKSWQQLLVSPTPYVVVHHGGLASYCYDQEKCSMIVRSYQDLHLDVRGWADIGYNFVIGEDGSAYVGRGWDRVGAHAPGYNSQSIGICIIGDFSDFMPNDTALEALNSLIACGVSMGKISKDYKVIGHRQVRDTLCPGETFYQYVTKMPYWTSKPVPLFTMNSVATAKPTVVAVGQNSLEVSDRSQRDTKQ